MSKPLFEDTFSLRGRRNRKSFLIGTIMLWSIGAFFIGFGAWNLSLVTGWDLSWEWRAKDLYKGSNIYNSVTLISAFILTFGGFLFFCQIYLIQIPQRLRDIGLSGWWIGIHFAFNFLGKILVPLGPSEVWKFPAIINLLIFAVLVFYPGTKGENKYGPDPLLPVSYDKKNSYPDELSIEKKSSRGNGMKDFFSRLSKRTRLVLFGCLIWLVVVPVYVFLFSPYGSHMDSSDEDHMLSVMFLPTLAIGGLYWVYERFVR